MIDVTLGPSLYKQTASLKRSPRSGVFLDMTRVLLLIGLYLAAGIAFVSTISADLDGLLPLFFVTVAAAAVVGWGTGNLGWSGFWLWVLLPWVIVPLGLPFGETVDAGGDDSYSVAAPASIPAFFSMVLMLLGAGARTLYERHHRGARPTGV